MVSLTFRSFLLRKEIRRTVKEEGWWATWPVWTRWRRKENHFPALNGNLISTLQSSFAVVLSEMSCLCSTFKMAGEAERTSGVILVWECDLCVVGWPTFCLTVMLLSGGSFNYRREGNVNASRQSCVCFGRESDCDKCLLHFWKEEKRESRNVLLHLRSFCGCNAGLWEWW